jgi:hypothetical protein
VKMGSLGNSGKEASAWKRGQFGADFEKKAGECCTKWAVSVKYNAFFAGCLRFHGLAPSFSGQYRGGDERWRPQGPRNRRKFEASEHFNV